jgi:hypothetical protein
MKRRILVIILTAFSYLNSNAQSESLVCKEANVEEWSKTVRKVKEKFPKVKRIIVGHGKSGGIELLDYTINLFK